MSEADTQTSLRRIAGGVAVILVWMTVIVAVLAYLSTQGGVDYKQPAPTTTCTTFTSGQGGGYVCTR